MESEWVGGGVDVRGRGKGGRVDVRGKFGITFSNPTTFTFSSVGLNSYSLVNTPTFW